MKTTRTPRLRNPLWVACLLQVSLLSFQAAAVNPPHDDSTPDDDCPCDEEECDTSGSGVSAEQDSIDLALMVGRAGYERPNWYPSFYATAGENVGDPRLPQGIEGVENYFEQAPVKGIFAAQLRLKSEDIDAAAFGRASLTYNSAMEMTVLKDTNGAVRQVLTNDFLVDLQDLTGDHEGYIAKWYAASLQVEPESGFYTPQGDVLKSVEIRNPDPVGTYDKLEVLSLVDSGNGSPRWEFYRYDYSVSGEYVLETYRANSSGPTDPEPIAKEVISDQAGSPGSRIVTKWVADLPHTGLPGDLEVVSRVLEVHEEIAGEDRLVSSTRLSSATATSAQTGDPVTTYGYHENTGNAQIDGRPWWRIDPDGSWVVWEITAGTSMEIKEITPVENATLTFSGDTPVYTESECRVVSRTYAGPEKTVGTTVQGTAVSSGSEKFLTGDDGERVTRKTRSDGITTHTSYVAHNPYGNGQSPEAGRIAWEKNEDGTATVYSYATNGYGGITVTAASGASTGDGRDTAPTVDSGECVVTAYGPFWQERSWKKYDGVAATGTPMAEWEVTAGNWDDFGRPKDKVWQFAGSAGGAETLVYDCCGLKKHTGRDGSVTTTHRDFLKRIYKVEDQTVAASTGVTTLTARDGLTTTVTRDGIFISETTRSLDGLTITTTGPSRMSANAADRYTVKRVTDLSARTTTKSYLSDVATWTELAVTTRYLDGRVSSVSGSEVTNTSYAYSAFTDNSTTGLKTTRTVSGIASSTYTDGLGRTLKTYSPATGNTGYAYHGPGADSGSRGKLESVTDGDGVATTYGYNAEGERTTTTRIVPVGDSYAATNLVTTVTRSVGTAPSIHGETIGICHIEETRLGSTTISTSYRSPDGLKSATTSLQGDTLSISTHPDSSTGIATTTVTNPDGTRQVTTRTHGLVTRVEKQTPADPTPSTISYREFSYDSKRRLLGSTDSRTGSTDYDKDDDSLADVTESGQVLWMESPNGEETSHTYDLKGRRTTVGVTEATTTNPQTRETHTSYHASDRVAGTWGDDTYPTYRLYNERGQMTELRTYKSLTGEPLPGTTADAATRWDYSTTTGLLKEKTYPDGDNDGLRDSGGSYQYTSAGRLWKRTSARNKITTYGYHNGYLTSIGYNDSTPGVTRTYDSLGRLASVANANADYSYDYAADFGIDTETIVYSLPGSTFSRVLDRRDRSYGRDTGWELEKTEGDPPVTTIDNQVTYGYDASTGFLETVADGNDTFTYGYQYNETGGLRVGSTTGSLQGTMPYTMTRSGSPTLQTIRSYEDDRNVLDTIDNRAGGSTVSKFDYTVNDFGQRKSVATTFSLGGSLNSNAGTTDWDYDDLGQVTSADAPDDNGFSADRSYAYDTIGNRTESADSTPLPQNPDTYASNALNQYTDLPTTSAAPVYDADGNATAYPVPAAPTSNATLGWDAENRLVTVEVGSTDKTYLYDPMGRRIAKLDGLPEASPTLETVYIYDGWNMIAEYAGTTLDRVYTWGMDLSGTLQGAGGVGGLLAFTDIAAAGDSTYYPTYDGNGNVSEYLEADGTVAAHFEYDPFGRLVVDSGSNAGSFPYRFSTKPQDAETGLLYYGYRWYDPVTGRWPSRDPIGERGGFNLYGFVGNDGVNRLDYLGRVEVVREGNKTVTQEGDSKSGSVGVYITVKFKKFDKEDVEKCYCYEGEKVTWWIQKNMPAKDLFGDPDWSKYPADRKKNWYDRYVNSTPWTYEGLDAHESTHVRQYESIVDEIEKQLKEDFEREFCYKTSKQRDKFYDRSTDNFSDPQPYTIKAFEDKYGPRGYNPLNKAELEAVRNEYEEYDRQYEEWKKTQ